MSCTENMNMNRIAPKALVRSYSDTYNELQPLTKRELELVNYALRFCPVDRVIERMDADSKRDMLNKLNEEMN
jgi:hypothetical protein